ncbi:MAG: 4-hydroxyphenylpyruvate dioxygenase [Bdellovibrionota bacterium]
MDLNQSKNTTERTVLENPIGLDGMEFIEYSAPEPAKLEALFKQYGFKKIGDHKSKKVSLWSQGRSNFIINAESDSFAYEFAKAHGPCACATGFRVKDAKKALEEAVKRGAKACPPSKHHSFPAIYGIGDSVIYFIDEYSSSDLYRAYEKDFNLTTREENPGVGLLLIDHLTNNVPKGEMQKWCDFYEKIFNFKEARYFDIKGKSTGLISKVMRGPDNKIMIPINEPSDGKSQIQEYLDEYKGSGIQHIALLTTDIVSTVKQLRANGVEFLNMIDTYFDLILKRLPQVTEDIDQLRQHKILVDGDHDGYLLQIFGQTVIGPIFFEIIQRKNHAGFGNGNFQALFDAIEEDQRRRGYLE